ncbi:MAG: discoidin domain-containing protein, partial [Planctomycetes bacterium]|nr:discoidin domain-containing protein [Planctomycetota bacterium]
MPLGPNVDEGLAGDEVWTDIPSPGWINDASGVPGVEDPATDGVTEWAGWGFADKDWWVETAGDQERSQFDLGQGTVAVADPDEWDDAGHPEPNSDNPYDVWLSTAPIDLSVSKAGTVQLRFDSSWRPEFDDNYHQSANLTVSFDGAEPIELFRWVSDSGDGNYKESATNETIVLDIDNPAEASSMVLTFGLFDAGNDWWWAIDNIVVRAEQRADRALNPSPLNQTDELSAKAVLTWTPGQYVGGLSPQHKVFLSDNQDAVVDGSALVSSQDANSFDAAGLLEYSTTYYWRVDEANQTSGWDEGSIWQFTIEPYSIPLDVSHVTASSISNEFSLPENTINGAGLGADNMHTISSEDMWFTAAVDLDPWIQYEFDAVQKVDVMRIWNSNSAAEMAIGWGVKDVEIAYSADGENWDVLAEANQLSRAPGLPTYNQFDVIDFGGVPAKYVRLNIGSNWGGILMSYGLSEVQFDMIPAQARTPDPADGATDVIPNTVLTWRSGREAVQHTIYVGTDQNEVANGLTPSLTSSTSRVDLSSLNLDLGTMYYWRVDEVNEADATPVWAGSVWRFTTAPAVIVDDFESYNNISPNRPFQTWLDGFGYSADEFFPAGYGGNGTGVGIGHDIWSLSSPQYDGDIMEGTIA